MSGREITAGSIDARLRQLHERSGMTILQMAEATGLSRNSLQNYMRTTNPQKPGVDAVAAICSGLRVTSDWLIGLSDDPLPNPSDDDLTEVSARLVLEQFIASLNHMQRMMATEGNGSVFDKEGRLFGASPADLASDYAYRILKLRNEMRQGTVDPVGAKVSYDGNGKPLNLTARNLGEVDQV